MDERHAAGMKALAELISAAASGAECLRTQTAAPADSTPASSAFSFDGREVRVVDIEGEIWFVAADVCAALDLSQITRALDRLDDDERKIVDYSTLTISKGRKNQGLSDFDPKSVNIVNESGLYSLVLTSRKPQAKRFKKWVTAEVLPAIRKTGSYRHPAAPAAPKTAQAAQFSAPLPPERYCTLDDRLYLSLQEIVRGEARRTPQGRLTNVVSLNEAKLLACLCRHRPESAPLARRWTELEAKTGIPRRGLKRALGNLAAMGYLEPAVERRGEGISAEC
jgi:prophage antirepressor-like protein